MNDRPLYVKIRVLVSRIAAIPLAALVFLSNSRWENHPMYSAVFFAVGCILVAASTAGRLWCSLYIAGYKAEKLVMLGPYSLCRHPLYLFSLLGAIGLGLVTETITIPLVMIAVFALYYPAVILSEEKRLAAIHGPAYKAYQDQVPQFIPTHFKITEPDQYVVNPKIYRKSMIDALWFVGLIGIIRIAETLRLLDKLPTWLNLY